MQTNITPIFLTQADDCVVDYFEHNKKLIEISNKYKVFITCSGELCQNQLRKTYPNAVIINCEENNDLNKINNFLCFMKNYNIKYDVCIRVCCDTIIVNIKQLLLKINKIINDNNYEKLAIGTVVKGSYNNIRWIRGGCVVVTKPVIDFMIDKEIDKNLCQRIKSFDRVWIKKIKLSNATIIQESFFNIGNSINDKFPVFHIKKYKSEERIKKYIDINKQL